MSGDKKKYYSAGDIKPQKIEKIETHFGDLDWIYGGDCNNCGIPKGTISLWTGPSGTGKSRLAVSVIKMIQNGDEYNRGDENIKFLYCQGELPLEVFASHIQADPIKNRNLFLSDDMSLSSIESMTKEIHPDILIVDSVNMIPEFNSQNSKVLINGDETHSGFRKLCMELGTTIILLGQVNQDGSNKGGTSLEHLVDVHLKLSCLPNGRFQLEVGLKNRYGKKGRVGEFSHTDDGVRPSTYYMLKDEEYWHGAPGIIVYADPVAPEPVPVTVQKPVPIAPKPVPVVHEPAPVVVQKRPMTQAEEDEVDRSIMRALVMAQERNNKKGFFDGIKQLWAETMELDWWEQRLNKKD